MKKRNPIAVFAFSFITLFIYSWYWLVKTKGEMNKMGEKIPTAFMWLIPVVGAIWWLWKYSEAVEHVTHKEISGVLAFVVLWLLGPIGNAIVQDYFNKIEAAPAIAGGAATPAAPAAPTAVSPSSPMNPVQPTDVTPQASPSVPPQDPNASQQPPVAPQDPTPPVTQ